jgi:hypothetical protein
MARLFAAAIVFLAVLPSLAGERRQTANSAEWSGQRETRAAGWLPEVGNE